MTRRMPTILAVSVDTEEDNWGWASSDPLRCENARELPRLVRFFERLGVRPTFFVTHAYLRDPSARDLIREMASEEWIEIGCHVHPWNTPPFDEGIPRRTMLYEYPPGLQRGKIASVSRLIEDVAGEAPSSFRAGRFGFGTLTARALLEEGYRVDSSVTPHWDWRQSSHGPSYLEAPLGIYRIKAGRDVLQHRPDGELIEVPLTSGYTRLGVDAWPTVTRTLDGGLARTMHMGGLAARLAGLRRVILSPEAYPAEDMLALGRRVIEGGVGHLHLFFHSSSLLPGLTPFTPTRAEVDGLYDRIERFLEGIGSVTPILPRSVTEAALAADDGPVQSLPSGAALPVQIGDGEPRRLSGFSGLREYGGIRVALAYLGRKLLWRLGRYRPYREVRWDEVRRLVFVCSGNICRSAYAQYWAGAKGLPAASIGVETLTGKPASTMTMKVAFDRGIDLDDHRTTRIQDFRAEPGDLFVAMEPWQARAALDQPGWQVPYQVTLLGLWIDGHGPVVLDPYNRSEECFVHCLSVLEAGVGALRERPGAWAHAQRADQA